MGIGAHWHRSDRVVAADTSRPVGKLRTALRPLGNASTQPRGRRNLLAGLSLLNESRSKLDLENLLGNDSRGFLSWARFVDPNRSRHHVFSLRRDRSAKPDLIQWRMRHPCIRLGGVSICTHAPALLSRPSHSKNTAAGEDRIVGRTVSAIQRLPDVFFYDCRKAVGRME